MSADELIVTLADMHATPDTCHDGGRRFCKEHGLDWRTFQRHGLPVSQVEGYDDAIVQAIIATARRRAAREAEVA